MLSVLTDMLQISKLENDAMEENLPTISLSSQVDEVFRKLTLLAEKNRSVFGKKETSDSISSGCLFPGEEPGRKWYSLQSPRRLCQSAYKNNTLVVLDDGIKIQEKDQDRIFKRFYSVDKSHNREKSVTGLGLSIVKHIVMKYHARIQLESSPGYGSAFIVTFPDNVYQWN